MTHSTPVEHGQHEAPDETRPEPVVEAARIAGTISGLVGTLATAFATYAAVTHQPWAVSTAATLAGVAAALAKVLPRVTATGARGQVTPVSDPLAADGTTPLVPARPEQ